VSVPVPLLYVQALLTPLFVVIPLSPFHGRRFFFFPKFFELVLIFLNPLALETKFLTAKTNLLLFTWPFPPSFHSPLDRTDIQLFFQFPDLLHASSMSHRSLPLRSLALDLTSL